MRFKRDSFQHIEPPQLVLTKASGERIGVLRTTSYTIDLKLKEPDELNITVPLYIDDERNPYYDYIQDMMYIEIPDDSRYKIEHVNIVSEGKRSERKEIVALSYECMLANRFLEEFYINTGDTASLDGINFASLLSLCINELFPEWTIGNIYGGLATMQRSFEISRTSVYDFLMNEVSTAFECIFVFDSYNKKITAYPESMYGESSGVIVSYDNLLKNSSMDLNVDDIKTCLTVTGSDDMSIREINRSYDRIYNFDYYNSTEHMSESLYNAFNKWRTLTYNTPVDWNYLRTGLKDSSGNLYFVFDNTIDLDGNYVMNFTRMQTDYTTFLTNNGLTNNYNNFYTFLLNRYQKYYTSLSEWSSTMIPAGNNKRYFGYGLFPTDFPTNKSEDTYQISTQGNNGKYTSVQLVTSVTSATRDENILYLISSGSNYEMYRWSTVKGTWINTNNWSNMSLAALNEKLKSAENNQAVAMKQGYGTPNVTDPTKANDSAKAAQRQHYNFDYLPYYYAVMSLKKYVSACETRIKNVESYQNRISRGMQGIAYLTAMENNFTKDQMKELSTFIVEEELSSENYVLTDTMTEDEQFEMLNALLKYGESELNKIAQPQMTFSADVANLFTMPEFDTYSGYIDVGNTVAVSLRDDYLVKPRITNIHYNFYDETDFSLTFSNILKKTSKYWSDVQDVLNEAKTISSSVSFNKDYWTQQAKNADTITQHIAAGLLSQGEYLKNGDDSELIMDSRGLFVTTTSGTYAYRDAIYIGGGRILFTENNWANVKMSVGRGDVYIPIQTTTGLSWPSSPSSKFGVYADYVLSGYMESSLLVGGDIYSANYKTSTNASKGNFGTHINLTNGTFEFNTGNADNQTDQNPGKKRLILNNNSLTVYGTIQASGGHIGCDDNGAGGFIITSNAIYNTKPDAHSTNTDGVYISTTEIALGSNASYTINSKNDTHAKFEVNNQGTLYASNAYITGAINATSGSFGNGSRKLNIGSNTTDSYIYSTIGSTSKTGKDVNAQGIYLGTDGIGLGGTVKYTNNYKGDVVNVNHSRFMVDNNGYLWCQNAVVQGAIYADRGTFKNINVGNGSFYIDGEGQAYFDNVKFKNYNDDWDDTSLDSIWWNVGNQEAVNEYLNDFIEWAVSFLYNIHQYVPAAEAPGDRPRKRDYKNTYDHKTPIG